MTSKVLYTVLTPATKEQEGRVEIRNCTFAAGEIMDRKNPLTSTVIGFYTRPLKGKFAAYVIANGEEDFVGNFESQSTAGHATRKSYNLRTADGPAPVQTQSLEEAAQEICGTAKNPLTALKKRIKRGSVETVEIDGETRVVKS